MPLLMSFQEGPEGDRGWISVTVPPFKCYFKKVYSRNGSFKEKSFFCKKDGKKVYNCQVSLLTLCYHWQSLSKLFLSMKYGVRAQEKKRQQSGGLGWIRGLRARSPCIENHLSSLSKY